jgi:hypothetical protein
MGGIEGDGRFKVNQEARQGDACLYSQLLGKWRQENQEFEASLGS